MTKRGSPAKACLTPEQFERVVRGDLPQEDAAALGAHLESCRLCRAGLDACRQNLAYLDDVAPALEGLARSDGSATITVDDRTIAVAAAAPPPAQDSIPGYALLGEIHRGGQGVVYRAVQHSTKRTVALKVLLDGPFASPANRSRFQREVEIIAGLRHPNIVVIHDSGVAADRYFFAMDLIDGLPLDQYVRSAGRSPRDVISMFIRICDAVSFAHRRGVMHRDLKPNNILVLPDATPFVLDFGLAKILSDSPEQSAEPAVTVTGRVMGTVRYMSPEQTTGDPNAVDIRTDVYSLGIILYELLTGQVPYDTKCGLFDALEHIRASEPLRPGKINRSIDSDLETIILKAIEKDPDRRYQSAEQMRQDFAAWLDRRPISARSASSLYVLRKLAVRHRLAATIIAALVVTVAAFTAISLDFYLQSKREQGLRKESDRTSAGLLADLDRAGAGASQVLRRQVLGWFIEALNAGRRQEACQIQDQLPESSPEYTAMEYLLNEEYASKKLLSDLPAGQHVMAYFVDGVRHARAGRPNQAIASFERCIQQNGDDWLAASAKARLRHLRSQRTAGITPPGKP
ncbi:MAG: serine/threonine-protein kinase [Phycisphaerae bacterium]